MSVVVSIDGELFDESATVSVFDRGFLYGDSVYEVLRTANGKPVDFTEHLARLGRSATAIALEGPPTAELIEAVSGALALAENDESYIRIMVTRGAGEIGLSTELARGRKLIVIVRPLVLPTADQYETGVVLRIVGVQRTSKRAMDPGVKSGNYLNNILALHEARRAGADEALMCDNRGRVAEGASSNVFIVSGGGLSTPSLNVGLLPGITRQRIIDLAKADGIGVSECELAPQQVRAADEVFITSSIRGVLPVSRVDERPVRAGAPGPVTKRVMELYALHLIAQAEQ